MKAKHYLLLSLVFSILSFIAFTLLSLIFLARKMPVFFAISIIGALFAVHMVYLSIKEIRTRDSDLGVNKNDRQ